MKYYALLLTESK